MASLISLERLGQQRWSQCTPVDFAFDPRLKEDYKQNLGFLNLVQQQYHRGSDYFTTNFELKSVKQKRGIFICAIFICFFKSQD